MVKRILKWVGIVIGVVLILLLVGAGVIYTAFPTTDVEVVRQVEASPEAMFEAFMDFDHWHDYWDIYEVFPPEGEISEGSVFHYDASEGYVTLEITEYDPGEAVGFYMTIGEDVGEGDFALRFESAELGTTVTASNRFTFNGPMRIMVALFALSGEVDSYYGNMIENVERVALEKRET